MCVLMMQYSYPGQIFDGQIRKKVQYMQKEAGTKLHAAAEIAAGSSESR